MFGAGVKKPTGENPELDFPGALAIARDSRATALQQRAAAHTLVAFGALDEADELIGRIERSGSAAKEMGALKAASRHLRRSGILESFRAVASDGAETSAGPQEALVSRSKQETGRLIVVFSGRAKRFWLSLQVLHQFLKKYNSNIMYLTDYSDKMYFNGLTNTAPGYDSMLRLIGDTATELGAKSLCVMANSGGGFIGLRAAADLRVESFLGLSIRTDFSSTRSVPRGDFARGIFKSGVEEGLLINLRPYLAGKKFPKRALLMCGDSHPADVAHAENLRGLPRFEVLYLPNYRAHDIVSGLLARGQFEGVLERFLEEADRGS